MVSRRQKRTQDQLLATHAVLGALLVVEQLGNTAESARDVGRTHWADDNSVTWFDPESLTLTVEFSKWEAEGARRALITLVENGYHGFIGAFEITDVKLEGVHVVVYLKEGAPEPLNDTLVKVAVTI